MNNTTKGLLKSFQENNGDVNKVIIDHMMENLKGIYSNTSSDEAKCKGDITKSPNYDKIEIALANLSSIKRLSKGDISDLKNLFNTLHRPIFKKLVPEYLKKPDERNIIFTATFSTGYRILVGELSRIIASTNFDEKGAIYKPDKIQRRSDLGPFIRKFNGDIDKRLDDDIKRIKAKVQPIQEAAALTATNEALGAIIGLIEGFFGFLNNIFSSAQALNPIALISALLTRSYDKKIEKFDEISAMYDETKKAYEEYMKIPATQRKKRIEHRYTKMMEKYNIKMGNLKTQIDHFDMRSKEEAKDIVDEAVSKSKSSSSGGIFGKFKKKKDDSSDDKKTSETPKEKEKEKTEKKESSNDNKEDDIGF